jgi:hypothetical protein
VVIFLYYPWFLGGIYTCGILKCKPYGTNKILPKNGDVAMHMTWHTFSGLLESFELLRMTKRA